MSILDRLMEVLIRKMDILNREEGIIDREEKGLIHLNVWRKTQRSCSCFVPIFFIIFYKTFNLYDIWQESISISVLL